MTEMTDQKPRRKWRAKHARTNPAARITRRRLRKGWHRIEL
jgi:hypothetical protein